MEKKTKTLKAKLLIMNGSNERYAGKRKYSTMKIMRVKFEKVRVMDLRKYGNNYSNSLQKKGATGFMSVTMFIPKLGSWRQGRKTLFGEKISLWTDSDYSSAGERDLSGYTETTVIPKCYINIFLDNPNNPTAGKGKDDGKL